MDTQNRNRNNNIFLDKPVQEKIYKEIYNNVKDLKLYTVTTL